MAGIFMMKLLINFDISALVTARLQCGQYFPSFSYFADIL